MFKCSTQLVVATWYGLSLPWSSYLIRTLTTLQ